jgi:hypothetical protein
MAQKPVPKRTLSSKTSKQKKVMEFPLEKINFIIIGAGILMIIIGYILMSENSVNGFMPTVVSPLLLVFGYCVVIPYGILKKTPSKDETSIIPEVKKAEEVKPDIQTKSNVSSNVKTN